MADCILTTRNDAGHPPTTIPVFPVAESRTHDLLDALEIALALEEALPGAVFADPADRLVFDQADTAWTRVNDLTEAVQAAEVVSPACAVLQVLASMIGEAMEAGDPARIEAVLDGAAVARALFPRRGSTAADCRATGLIHQAMTLVRRLAHPVVTPPVSLPTAD